MKRWLLIIGIVIIVILLGVWAYLVAFGNPNKEGIFNAFGLGDSTEEGIIPFIEDLLTPDEEPTKDNLRQLTLRRVAGYSEVVKNASSSPEVYFVEAGTGHIYTLNIVSGEERRISNITVPVAIKAEVATDGSFAAIKSENEEITIISLTEKAEEMSSFQLTEKVTDFSITDDNILLYSTETSTSVLARSFDPDSKATKPLFEVPFKTAVIVWGGTASDTHLAYPKPAANLEGYAYSFNSGSMSRLPVSGFNLSLIMSNGLVVFNKTLSNEHKTFIYNLASGETYPSEILTTPEKCVVGAQGMSCAVDSSLDLTRWRKGEVVSNDLLYFITPHGAGAKIMDDVDLVATSRQIDAVSLQTAVNSTNLYFINSVDQTLWAYLPDNN